MLDFAPRLADFKPEINWENSCNDKFCAKTSLKSQRGSITVPTNYESYSATLKVGVQRLTVAGTKPRIHFILLSGGPGGYGSDQVNGAEFFTLGTKGEVASYMVDHRGLGTSGEFVSKNVTILDFLTDSDRHIAKAPFDVRHLSTENAALDVGMIAMAIKSSPDWMPDSRLVVYGFSYGSQWAHHSAMRLPNLYDSVIIGGIHFPRGKFKESLQGIADNCAMDTFCRKKMGGNVEQTYRKTVRNVLNPNYNECTALFHKTFGVINAEPAEEKVRALAFVMMDLALGRSRDFEDSLEYRSVMAILPILKATNDCLNVAEYRKKVLIPLDKYVNDSFKGISAKEGPDVNVSVNILTTLNGWHCHTDSKIPYLPPDHSDIHPNIAFDLASFYYYHMLESHIKGRTCTVMTAAKTTKTAFYIAQSRMDMPTPLGPGWELYQEIEAPSKSWLLYDHRSHDGYFGKCMKAFFVEALIGKSEFDYEACMKEENADRKVDWTLKHAPDFRDVWDLVADESNTTPVITHLPTYAKGSRPVSEPIVPIGPISRFSNLSTGMLILGIGGIVALVVAAIIFYFMYKKRRSKAHNQEQSIPA